MSEPRRVLHENVHGEHVPIRHATRAASLPRSIRALFERLLRWVYVRFWQVPVTPQREDARLEYRAEHEVVVSHVRLPPQRMWWDAFALDRSSRRGGRSPPGTGETYA